jgi:hypothetical protein
VFWFALSQLLSCLVDRFTVRHLTGAQKDLQIWWLRQQVRGLQHQARQPRRFFRLEKTLLAVLVAKIRRTTNDFRAQVQPVLIFSPDTVLRWHRELVRRKWTCKPIASAGRLKMENQPTRIFPRLLLDRASASDKPLSFPRCFAPPRRAATRPQWMIGCVSLPA